MFNVSIILLPFRFRYTKQFEVRSDGYQSIIRSIIFEALKNTKVSVNEKIRNFQILFLRFTRCHVD